jgi:hypothetical protein
LSQKDEPAWKRRFGPRNLQDWYCGLVKSKHFLGESGYENSLICIASENSFDGIPEIDTYAQALEEIGVTGGYYVKIPRGRETIGHMQSVLAECKPDDEVTFIASPLHFPRVWWLARDSKVPVECTVAWGIPRPFEALTDAVLAIVFPLIDFLGYRDWFVEKTTGRRAEGVL